MSPINQEITLRCRAPAAVVTRKITMDDSSALVMTPASTKRSDEPPCRLWPIE